MELYFARDTTETQTDDWDHIQHDEDMTVYRTAIFYATNFPSNPALNCTYAPIQTITF